MNGHDPARWGAALRLLRYVERRTGIPSTWQRRVFRVEGPHAVWTGTAVERLQRPVRTMARQVADDAATIAGRCAADVVRLGKFDVDEVVRFRAFHVTGLERATSLRVQGAASMGGPGVEREFAARRQVADHAPALAPPLLEYGTRPRRRVAFLRDEVVRGRHPRDRDDVQAAVEPLVAGLRRLHEGVGVDAMRLSDVVSARFAQRWEELAAEQVVPPDLAAKLSALLERDALLEVSLGHGDLVRTNLLLTRRGRVVLLDWEYARPMPIAFDLAKPVFLAADPAAAIEQVRAGMAGVVAASADSYGLEEQLALAIAQMLTWSETRADRAAAAGRQELFERDTVDRVKLLEQLVG